MTRASTWAAALVAATVVIRPGGPGDGAVGAGGLATAGESPIPRETAAVAAELLGTALPSRRAYETLQSLTDGVGPRLAGSEGDRRAVAWAVETLKAQGFENVRAEPVKVPVWKRGEARAEMLEPAPQPLVLCALGGSVPTEPGGLEAEVVEAGSLQEIDALGERARGKIVLGYRRTPRERDGAGYGQTVDLRGQGPSRAAKVGAVGYLIRSIGTSDNRLPHTGALHYAEGVPKIPSAALSNPDADLLHRLLAQGKRVRVRFALGCQTLPDTDSANVVGEVRGRSRPDEIVLLGAHLDSWDLGTGAIDDGAGCATVVEAARLIGELGARRPRRTVRVVLYANEENGLRGGKAYAVAHASELARHVAAFEADSGGARPWGVTWKAGPSAAPLFTELARLLSGVSPFTAELRGDGGADISPLKVGGVPLLGLRCDSSRYFDYHHTANDTLDKVDPAELAHGVAATAVLAYTLADLPEPIERPEPEPPSR